MDKIKIIGGYKLEGQVPISGAKNAVLPIIAAGILTNDELIIENVPQLSDVDSMLKLLMQIGVTTKREKDTLIIHGDEVANNVAPYDLVRKMRTSILVLGPLLAKYGYCKVSLPGGCAIGARPVDLHIKGMEALGADIKIDNGYIIASVPKSGLIGAEIVLPTVTVTGTENIMMAAVLAEGTTKIVNGACEPEIVDLGHCLIAMGARIKGLGTSVIEIEGVKELHGATHQVIPDRLEAGTYAIASAISDGCIELVGNFGQLLDNITEKFNQAGLSLVPTDKGLLVKRQSRLQAVDITTNPYPGFPTDLQAQFMAMMCLAQGKSVIKETIFENRFMHVPELCRMGADIKISGNSAIINGVKGLTGAEVMATDLRASVSLVLAGLSAEGVTMINRVYHLDRGYENLEGKLGAVGANIARISDKEDNIVKFDKSEKVA